MPSEQKAQTRNGYMIQRRNAEPSPFHFFRDAVSRPLIGKLRTAEMHVARAGFGRDWGRIDFQPDHQNAYYICFGLSDLPPYEYQAGGPAIPVPASPQGSVHILDLNAAPSALFDGQFDGLNMLMPRTFLNELAEEAGAAPVTSLAVAEPWAANDPILQSLAQILVGALADGSSCSTLFLDHLTTVTALHMAERYGGLRQPGHRVGALAPWQERRAREMIAANLTKDMSLAEIAAECRLSLAHFSRAFKVSVGMTPHGWLQANRINTAKELLEHSTQSFAEIAVQCGFVDQSHFSRTFKRATGVTPGLWRRLRLS